MSDVDALSSLPAAPDAGKSSLANNVKHQPLFGPSPPKVASPKPVQPRDPDVAPKSKADSADDGDQPLSPKADSEAETIIQSGRESVSPEKRRKYIQHDPKRRDARNNKFDNNTEDGLPSNGDRVRRKTSADTHVRDRSNHARDSTRPSSDSPDRRSPAQSPARNRPLKRPSPSAAVKKEKSEDSSSADHRAKSLPRNDKPSISRKRSFSECGNGDADADEYHSRFDNRLSAASRGRTNGGLNGVSLPRPASIDRSVSPVRPFHKRTVSGPQLGAGSDATSKRRKAPTPLLTGFSRQGSEDRHSISSSTSGSPLPSAHVRKITALDGTSASPARVMGPKKQRDQNGRTRLARACAAQELDTAIARHAERPEDLNVADNAGNTPLQIAALEGSAPIVKFLIEVGCDLDTRNIDKDTPLIDAVENGHLDVVKILLAAGINPRAVNAEGDEPYELVPNDCEDYDEIRRIIAEAKAAPRPGRRSEERKDTPLPRASVPSPRESPPVEKGPRSPILNAPFPRRRTGRSEVTRNDLLWTKATPENLQAFAAKGDMAGVATILNVGQKADPESMIAAAKGGHDEVLSLMLGIGFADPDPDPVHASGQKAGYNTPMLAAIGRGNLAVIRLLLDQPGFNPTRRLFRDCTYYELSRDRKGENWEEESELLKGAYDSYSGKKKSRKVEHSSPRRPRDREKDANNRHTRRDSRSPVVRARKVAGGSPNRRESAPKERKRDGIAYPREKPGTARPKALRRDSSDNDDSENRVDVSRPKQRDDDSEATHRGDGQPKRRRLIAGRPPQARRQTSLPSSDSMSGREENVKPSETAAPAKRGPTLKRIRSSESPHRPSHGTDAERPPPDAQKKKRRVLSEDGAPTNGSIKKSHDSSADVPKTHPRPKRDEDNSQDGPPEHGQPASHKPSGSSQQKGVAVPKAADRSVVKEERDKVETHELDDIPMAEEDSSGKGSKADEQEEAARREAKKNKAAEAQRELQATLAENARKAEEERAALLAREQAQQQQQAEDERRRKEAEQRRQKQAEDERQKKLEQERARVAKMRKEQEEKEQRRREALPNRLRVAAELVGSNDPRAKSHGWLKRFMPLVTAQTKQLDPQCEASVAEEKWIPNYLVAPLLATNDLQLSQYVSWEKRTVTPTQRANLWRVTRRMLVPAEDTEASGSSMGQILQKDCATRPKYFEMEHVFWVKVRIIF